MKRRVGEWDSRVFQQVAARKWPLAEGVLPRLSRSADHGLLWFGVAAGIAAVGGHRGRRAALRGVGSLAVASAVVNTVGKRSVGRARPLLDGVPVIRRLARQPFTTSFPSGHSASAAAFATGVFLESRRWGTAVAPVAWSVAFSRIYTGVHYPGDVLAGAAIGAGAAIAVRALVPAGPPPGPARVPAPGAEAPRLPRGRGLFVVVNAASGQFVLPEPVRRLRSICRRTGGPPAADVSGTAERALALPAERLTAALPHAEVTVRAEGDGLGQLLEKAARRAAEQGGALGVYGGDGTVGVAAAAAMRHGVPLAVFPGGTFNHFALDLGVRTVADTARAVEAGGAVAVDVGRIRPEGAWAGPEEVPFLNTFSLGAYPELVRYRERWERRVGTWPAGVLAAVSVLRTAEPLRLEINGRRRSVWLVFAGNCSYRGLGLAPVRRHDLADGLLDVRIVDGGRFARTRLLAAAATGALTRSPVYSAASVRRLRISGLGAGTHLAYDGEVTPAPSSLTLEKAGRALTVYRPS
ncbi:bifunctional phosphatase PAP2/diacylglycerol kinase family protein [Actinacidiphila oryziradicis]|uniref:Phosphatase PAP2 family protein n=1 Tax=Actinacidiphila oryziradicis TaxID=2571141 RepID=A0A4U0SQ34_9ACTN|nr:phosphatase PAP2 family protein [Actinacidiphila oryziradicis]TKA12174.1 phosphatase PAP2 family protein [Actinacidiphila oryziradicis]